MHGGNEAAYRNKAMAQSTLRESMFIELNKWNGRMTDAVWMQNIRAVPASHTCLYEFLSAHFKNCVLGLPSFLIAVSGALKRTQRRGRTERTSMMGRNTYIFNSMVPTSSPSPKEWIATDTNGYWWLCRCADRHTVNCERVEGAAIDTCLPCLIEPIQGTAR